MEPDSGYLGPLDSPLEDFAQIAEDMPPAYDFLEGEDAGFGPEQDRFDYEACSRPNAFHTFLDGSEYDDALYSLPIGAFIAQATNSSSQAHAGIPSSINSEGLPRTENNSKDIDMYGAFSYVSEQDGSQDWSGRQSTITPELPKILRTATASTSSNASRQSAPASQSSNDNIKRPGDLTSQQVTQHLRSVRVNIVQPAVTLFQTDDTAKRWRKRGQNQAILDVQDTDFPRGPGEEREYVHLLKSAFKYMGAGCKYTQQEQLFMTRLQTEDSEKEIESWCWQLLKEITRRQSRGRPLDLAKRKNAYLDSISQTFAERFSVVFNALKLEKRCCIRFSNMAGWHKRLANDPLSEMAEVENNDCINHKKAEEKKAKIAEAKALADALDKEKAKGTPKQRAMEDSQSGYTTDSPSTSAFGSGKTTPKRTLPFGRGKIGRSQTLRVGSPSSPMSTPENCPRGQPPPEGLLPVTSAGRTARRPSRTSEKLSASPLKKLKLDDGSANVPRTSTRSNAAYEGEVGSSLMYLPYLPGSEASYQGYFGSASCAVSTPSPYETSASEYDLLRSDNSQQRPQKVDPQLTKEQPVAPAAYESSQEEFPVPDEILAEDHFDIFHSEH